MEIHETSDLFSSGHPWRRGEVAPYSLHVVIVLLECSSMIGKITGERFLGLQGSQGSCRDGDSGRKRGR